MYRKIYLIIFLLLSFVCDKAFSESVSVDKYLSPILTPIKIVASFMFAVSLGIGILGFIILVAKGALNWITGGTYGRTNALRTFESAAEILAIIPIMFLIIEVLKAFNITQVNEIAKILESMLNESFHVIVKLLQSEI